MPKWRKFHLKTLDSVDINDMPDDFTRLLWAYLPLILDSAGRGIDNATWVRSKAFPMRHDVTDEKCELALIWFAERGMIERYEVGPRQYFCIPTWEDYQGKTDREALSVIPEKPSKPLKNKAPQVKSKSRPTHDLGPSWSGLDVDVDVDVDESTGAVAPPLKKERPQDELFNAIVEVCGVDISIKGNDSSVGKVRAALVTAKPPYTPEDVRAWGQTQAWRAEPPTIWQLKSGIGSVRRRPPTTNGAGPSKTPAL